MAIDQAERDQLPHVLFTPFNRGDLFHFLAFGVVITHHRLFWPAAKIFFLILKRAVRLVVHPASVFGPLIKDAFRDHYITETFFIRAVQQNAFLRIEPFGFPYLFASVVIPIDVANESLRLFRFL